jgi:hypothetical protein
MVALSFLLQNTQQLSALILAKKKIKQLLQQHSGGALILLRKTKQLPQQILVPEIIDPVFAKTSQNARFLLSEYERFGLVFTKTRVYKFGHW